MDKSKLDSNVTMAKDEGVSSPTICTNDDIVFAQESGGSKGSRMEGSCSVSSEQSHAATSQASHNLLSSNRHFASTSTNEERNFLWNSWTSTGATHKTRNYTRRLLVETPNALVTHAALKWNGFFHSRTHLLWVGSLLRIGVSIIVIHNVLFLLLDAKFFFQYLVPSKVGITLLNNPDMWTLFRFIPNTWNEEQEFQIVLWSLRLWLLHATLLCLGILPRFQAIANFLYLASFQNHDDMIWSSSDTAVRLLSFFLIFLPLHHGTIYSLLPGNHPSPSTVETWPMWPFRLVQIEMCIIYWSTALSKFSGPKWLDGTVLYYIAQLDDVYGKFFHPEWLFGRMTSLSLATYATLVLEVTAPILLFVPTTRNFALFSVTMFHFGIDLSMNLGCFHWIMIVGFCSFLAEPMQRKGIKNSRCKTGQVKKTAKGIKVE